MRSVSFFRSGLCVVSRLAFFRTLCGGKGDGQLLFCINAALAGRLYRNRNRFSGCVVLQLFFQLLNGADGLTIEFCDDVTLADAGRFCTAARSNACYINTCGDAIGCVDVGIHGDACEPMLDFWLSATLVLVVSFISSSMMLDTLVMGIA